MIINIRMEAQPDNLFEGGCLDENIGDVVDLNFIGSDGVSSHVAQAEITAVSIANDGTHAWMTIEVPNVASETVDIGPIHLSAAEGPGYMGYAEEGL